MAGKHINPNIFRSYDIRGIYPTDIDEDVAARIGSAFGQFIGRNKKVLIGRDIRISSPSLSENLLRGVLGMGLDVVYAGEISTPMLHFAVAHYKLDGGIQVSASHNPPEWNGFKICRGEGHAVGIDNGLKEIRDLAERNEFEQKPEGRMTDRSNEIMHDYLSFLTIRIEIRKGLKVGIDPGNGAYSKIASNVFREKGAEVFAINDIPDGRFPSRSPEPKESTITELINLVRSKSLDFGVAFDSDGDRALFVTDTGMVLGGDMVLALLVKEYVQRGDKVAYEVSCSKVVEDMINEKGGVPVLSKVGYIYLADKMKNENCIFGGEISSHLYFRDIYGSDDGLYAALKIADFLTKSKKKLSELVSELPKYLNRYEEFDADDNIKFKVIDEIASRLKKGNGKQITLDGIKVITDKGWFILRVSNTTPKIKCRVEAGTEADLDRLLETATNTFKEAYASVRQTA